MTLLASLRTLVSVGLGLKRLLDLGRAPAPGAADAQTLELLRRAGEARQAGRPEEAGTLYRQILQSRKTHLGALRGLRDLAAAAGRWSQALETQRRIMGAVGSSERSPETEWLAVLHYELGRAELSGGHASAALPHLKNAVRADRHFLPAALAVGDAHEMLGEHREAVRAWERAAEIHGALPLLARLERAYRQDGRPTRMIALYREALEKAPDDLALAVALGRVFFELEMLDEAADQLEKVEVRAPDLPVVHAFLGAVFERRGQMREAFEEYRRALRLGHAFDWPHRCDACGAATPVWQDRCPACRRWNTLRPARP
ncbi:MAG: tetratricopeptide repeat protein [Candidatus Rokubacteria bacterium]|nr:tetratricopeptide repeat protein [Candidatus Rokubacteria bacterium]